MRTMIAHAGRRDHCIKGQCGLPEGQPAPRGRGSAIGEVSQPLGQPAELGRRAGAELGHDLRALQLDGALGDAQIVGDLLVEPAGDDAVEDFALARGEQGEARPQPVRLVAGRALRASRSSARGSRRAGVSRSTGLVRKSTAPAFIARTLEATSACPVRKTTGSATPWRRSASCRSRPEGPGIRTSSSRQPGRSGRRMQQEVARRGVAARLEAGRAEQPQQGGAQRVVVVDDVDQWRRAHAALRRSGGSRAGERQLDLEHRPLARARSRPRMRPPCASTSVRAIESPSPMPVRLVVKNESNSFGRCSGAMPGRGRAR